MMLIDCPWCGERAQIEFSYGGDGMVARPSDPQTLTDAAWHEYVYLRDNPRGPHVEFWHHARGCRQWFKVRRDTVTHEILGTAKPGEEP